MAETLFDLAPEGPPPLPAAIPAPFSAPAFPEVLLSLSRSVNPRWRQCYGHAAPPVATDRSFAALRLGITLTESFCAAYARDADQAGQQLADAAAVEKMLGISETTRPRHLLLQEFAKSGEWEVFRQSLASLCDEQRAALEEQRDPDLARLLPVAAWLRTLEIEAALLANASAPTLDPVGMHPDVVTWIQAELSQLDDSTRSNRSVARCIQAFDRLSRLLQHPVTEGGRREKLLEVLQTTLARLQTP